MSLETIGSDQVYVRNYTNNFAIKEYIQNVMIPDAFPDISVNKLNLGLVGIVSELIGQGLEDAAGTASLMMNESFITKAVLPESIYANASLFGLDYSYAVPARATFCLLLLEEDVLSYSESVANTSIKRYKVDKNTKILLGEYGYVLDHDIFIDSQTVDGNVIYTTYYDDSDTNSISSISNKYIRQHVVDSWIMLVVDLQQFSRKVTENSITDNLVTVNSDITLRWSNQLAGVDLTYVTAKGVEIPMTMKSQNSDPIQDPFVYYKFKNDQTMVLTFSNNNGYFMPEFNSKIVATVYSCYGESANFDSYNDKSSLAVTKSGDVYEYNASTKMTALCYSGASGGLDKGDIELLRTNTILAYNTANILSTDNDLSLWFESNAIRYGTKSQFFKRRDDFSGRLFSQFIAITEDSYVYPTNTLSIDVYQDEFDFIMSDESGNNSEFIIKPGHLWEYADETVDGVTTQVRDRVRMVQGINGVACVTDDAIPSITTDRPFMFVNPFFIKIHKSPTVIANYNYLISETSIPSDLSISSETCYQFHITTTSIERTLSSKNTYTIQAICLPVSTNDSISYVEGINSDDDETPNMYPKENNNLRLVLITKSRADGETGYIEMTPIESRNNNAVLFEVEISVMDNLCNDMMIDIDMDETDITSLIRSGDREGRVVIDSSETMFDFAIMFKDIMGVSTTNLYEDESFKGYLMASRFSNAYRDLILYKPMSMMRSTVTFAGTNDDYSIRTEMIPMLKYDIPSDDAKMLYFIRAFNEQYKAMEPVLDKLGSNVSLDFKLMNTYGRSENYYIGPDDDAETLWESNIRLDNVYVGMKFMLYVNDRSIYNQTVDAVITDIINHFDGLSTGTNPDVHVSNIIRVIENNQPNVRHLTFKGFNNYDANKQSIFVKYDSISDLKEDQLRCHVPELIRVDADSIEIIEGI